MFRLIDFVLSNLLNSAIPDIYVLANDGETSLLPYLRQYQAHSRRHNGHFLLSRPPRIRGRKGNYVGTADAVYQNLDLIRRRHPDLVLIFGSDHIYFMNVIQMIDWHMAHNAAATIATIPMPLGQSAQFGTLSVTPDWRIQNFVEKSPCPRSLPEKPDQALVSMGNYVFNCDELLEELIKDARRTDSRHDFGHDILPRLCQEKPVYAYDYRRNSIPGLPRPTDYWRDVGTIESFYRANFDLKDQFFRQNIFEERWPIRSGDSFPLPARLVSDVSGKAGIAENSILGGGSIIEGATVRDSVIGPHVQILSGAVVEDSVVLGRTVIKERAQIRKAIVDRGSVIGIEDRIGFDLRRDAARFHVGPSGIVVVPGDNNVEKGETLGRWTEDVHTDRAAVC
jgi:glucose-1-phosphate adenylyltransferase